MDASNPDQHLHVVLHYPYESIRNVIETKLKCEQTIWYEHPPSKREVRHCHGYINGLSVTRQQFKNWITEELGMKPDKGSWSFMREICKGDKKGQKVGIDCIPYFHKGQYPMMYKHGITDEEVVKYESLSFKPPEKEASGKKGLSHTDHQLAKKGLTHWDIVEYVREKAFKVNVLKKDPATGCMIEQPAYSDYGQIYDLLCAKLEECKIKTHQSDLERWFCTIIRNDASGNAVVRQNILNKYSKI